MKKYTQKEFDAFPVDDYGIKICPSGDYSLIKSFGKRSSFGEGSSFGEESLFNFFPICILRADLNNLSSNLILELMRRNAWAHPYPEKFDEWAKGGNCPYVENIERMHFFNEKRELWEPGAPTMKDSDLIIAICKEKGWSIKY